MNRLRGLGALAWGFLIETWRSRPAVFWNLVLPLVYVVGLSYIFAGGEPARVERILPGILTISVLTACFFGVSLHMVALREQEFYRRLRVTPVSSLAIVLAHAATALVNILVASFIQLLVAWLLFRVRIHGSMVEVAIALLLSAAAFIPLGLLVGSVAQDMKTGPALSNLLFLPLMFLSGATLPLYLMPAWLQHAAALLPATYVVEILQRAMLLGDPRVGLAGPGAILALTGGIGFAADAMLFRWESRQPVNFRALGLVLACLAVVYGVAFARGPALESARFPVGEESRRSPAVLRGGTRILTGMTVLDGSGGRIERARVVLQDDRITEVRSEDGNLPAGVPVTTLSGLYLIPGLIDSHVHIGGSAGGAASSKEFMPSRVIHDLQVYLALGITSVVSLTDDLDDLQALRRAVADGTMRAPRPYFSGPGLTAPRGHPARFFGAVPGLPGQLTRQVARPEAAAAAVGELAAHRIDLVKFFLEAGWSGQPLPVLAEPAFRAGVRAARERGLRTTVHLDNDRHARLAIEAGASSLEHVPSDLSDATISELVAERLSLTPTLAVSEALVNALAGAPVTDPLARRWVEPEVLASLQSPDSWLSRVRSSPAAMAHYRRRHQGTLASARRAVAGGVTILAGSDAGNPGAFHGPGLLRELELLVQEGGMSPAAAIVAATGAAARRLGTTDVGRIAPGAFADLVVLSADPARDIRALRDIRAVYFGGATLDRETILTTSPGSWMPRSGVEIEDEGQPRRLP